MEPVKCATSSTFTLALLKIQLLFGPCNTFVLNNKREIYGVFKEACDLLQLTLTLSHLSDNYHNPMMVKWINCYLNKGLKIMYDKRGTIRIAMEAIILLLYVWNSGPIPGTDLSHCFVALGREFQFPNNFPTNKHWEVISSPASILSYSCNLATHLSAWCKISRILMEEQHLSSSANQVQKFTLLAT